MELLDQAPTLRARVVRGRKMKKLVKRVGGVSLRLAYAGGATVEVGPGRAGVDR